MTNLDPRVDLLLRRLLKLSSNYHNLSCLLHELAQSLRHEAKTKSYKEIKAIVGKLDVGKIIDVSQFAVKDLFK